MPTNEPAVTRIKATTCLECGNRLSAVGTSDGAPGSPTDGDPCACIRCGAVMAFDGAGGLRGFTDAEMNELVASDTMDDLARLVKRIHIIRAGVN